VSEEAELPPVTEEVVEGPKTLSKKKLLLFIVLPLVLLLGGGAGLYFSGVLNSVLHKKDAAAAAKADAAGGKDANKGPGYYYDVPDILVNMNDSGSKQRYLKLSMSLELASKEEQPKLEAVMPRITDGFQTYLRELRVDDLRGSAGIYRLRLELLARVRAAADPVVVRDVLFREILVQ
jgi:flagellar FliL protein